LNRTAEKVEQLICDTRGWFPAWGGRKIRGFLLRQGQLGVPAASTITQILRRNGLLAEPEPPRRDYLRWERSAPNELWQMDFKGSFALSGGGRCYPFGLIDDYSRYSLALQACPDQQTGTVQIHLRAAFQRYGLPEAMLMDNGSPWGTSGGDHNWTPLTVWLCDLGIQVIHSQPFHPQTNGKKERLHHTLDLEVINTRPSWNSLQELQTAFDAWEPLYNYQRPHQSLGETVVPADRFTPSPRSYPNRIEPPAYPDDWQQRRVDINGRISYRGQLTRIGKPFHGQTIAITPTPQPNIYHVYYRHHHIHTITLSTITPNARPL
jgi:transposase InsO family protein